MPTTAAKARLGAAFRKDLPRLQEKTITGHLMTLRYLVHHFGEPKTLGSIDVPQAESWVEALAIGKLSGARSEMASRTGTSEHMVRDHIATRGPSSTGRAR